MKKFTYGNKEYTYNLEQKKRKTFALTITPSMEISVKTPLGIDIADVEHFLIKKIFWIDKQLNFFSQFKQVTRKKEYISGEGFLYLGRRYMLVLEKSKDADVTLVRGKLIVATPAPKNQKRVEAMLDEWFKSRAKEVFAERLSTVLEEFDYDFKPALAVRKMRRRWGSYSSRGKVLLNTMLIHATKRQIDYVITHELCHAVHNNHSKDFYDLLEQKFPKWQLEKEKLEKLIFNDL